MSSDATNSTPPPKESRPLPKGARRTAKRARLTVMVTRGEKKTIKQECRARRITESEWAREKFFGETPTPRD